MLRCLRWTMLPALIALSACGGGGGSSASAGLGTSSSSGVSASSSSSSSSSGASSSSSSGASSSSGGAHVFSTSSPNVVALTVGPGTSNFFNIPTTSVTVCIPGTSTCTTVTNVLVDTGSVGLRLMASALNGFALTRQPDPSAPTTNVIAECLPFADGFTWGPVVTADVILGGEKATGVPVNVIDNAHSFSPTIPTSCSNDGTALSSISALGSNGVLGVGLFAQDCGAYCAQPASQQTAPFFYYSCTSSTCVPASEPVNDQVVNPVALFATDNNGVILQLPAIPDSGQTSVTGFLVFGIGTEANNGLGSATVLTADPGNGTITTLYKSQTLTGSFLDSGSNGLFFPDSTIADCPGNAMAMEFYCPPATLSLTATNQGQNGNTSVVSFKIANVQNLNTEFALDDVGGAATTIMGLGTSYFDFGLPFFYGRTVFTAIEGLPAGGATGPYFAY